MKLYGNGEAHGKKKFPRRADVAVWPVGLGGQGWPGGSIVDYWADVGFTAPNSLAATIGPGISNGTVSFELAGYGRILVQEPNIRMKPPPEQMRAQRHLVFNTGCAGQSPSFEKVHCGPFHYLGYSRRYDRLGWQHCPVCRFWRKLRAA